MRVPSTLLNTYFDQGGRFDPLFGRADLSDHLPMALWAAWQLGASDAQLAAFRDNYVSRLRAAPAVPEGAAGSVPWRDMLGRRDQYAVLRAAADAQRRQRGMDNVLREWLPVLIADPGADAFHPLIRLGCALQSGHEGEQITAIAYWASCFNPCQVASDSVAPLADASAMFSRLRNSTEFGGLSFRGNTFTERATQLFRSAAFAPVMDWRGLTVTLADLAREAARVYLASHDFFALHMVTGTHAFRVLLQHMPALAGDRAPLDRLWQALAAVYVVIGAPQYALALADEPAGNMHQGREEPPSRDHLLSQTLQLRDEHAIKLAFSATEEDQAYGLPEHRLILRELAK